MATLTKLGAVTAKCPGCKGSLSTFEWVGPLGEVYQRPGQRGPALGEFGTVTQRHGPSGDWYDIVYKLFRCAGCGAGGIGAIKMKKLCQDPYPLCNESLIWFHPEVRERLKLPKTVPEGIQKEFEEAERCLEAGCFRAAAGLFRSVLDKTMRANGYNTHNTKLYNQIEAAAADGVITESRKKRAHDEIRVLGNDVLHDEWVSIPEEAVELAHQYAQRILEDFYDDRLSTLTLLRAKNRVPDEDKP